MATPSGAGGHDGAAINSWFIEVVELFEGEDGDGELDEAGRVEVLAGVEVVGVEGESGAVLGVAVDLGVDDLEFVLGILGDAL